MKFNIKNLCGVVTALTIATTTLVGCGNENISNKVSTDGSTSMEKVIGLLGEYYQELNPNVVFTYNPTGSGAGINSVKSGRADIGLSSRYLSNAEQAEGLKGEILAYDGIAIIVNKNNKINNLSLEEVAEIYTGKITNWKQLGGDDLEIVLIGREAGSGTRDGFESITKTSLNCKYRQELTSTGDVITTVSNNENAIGYASVASVKNTVNIVSIDGVTPSEETIKDGSYKIQRPYLLVTKNAVALSKTAQEFYDFILSKKAHKLILKAGAVPATSK